MDTSFSPCRMNHGIGDPAAEENVPRALLVTWRGGPITNHLDIFFFVCGCTVATAGLLGVVFPCSGGSVRARGEPVTALSPPPPPSPRGAGSLRRSRPFTPSSLRLAGRSRRSRYARSPSLGVAARPGRSRSSAHPYSSGPDRADAPHGGCKLCSQRADIINAFITAGVPPLLRAFGRRVARSSRAAGSRSNVVQKRRR